MRLITANEEERTFDELECRTCSLPEGRVRTIKKDEKTLQVQVTCYKCDYFKVKSVPLTKDEAFIEAVNSFINEHVVPGELIESKKITPNKVVMLVDRGEDCGDPTCPVHGK